MAQNFLTIANNDRVDTVNLWMIIKKDIALWIASAGLTLLIFTGITALVGSFNPNVSDSDVVANVFTWARWLYFALVTFAVFLARRSNDAWTWALVVTLIIFFVPQGATTIAIALMPNSILQALLAMIGFLAAGRIVEYVRMRYIIKLSEPTLTLGAMAGYIILILAAIFMNTPIFFEITWN